jgi:hypothetical protein
VEHEGVIAGTAGEHVGAAAAVEGVVAGVAEELVGECVAAAREVAGTLQHQRLDVVGERVGDAGEHRVGAGVGVLEHQVAGIVDEVGVVASATLHDVGAALAVEQRLATFSARNPSPIPTSWAGTRICRSGRDQVDGRQ